MSITPTLHRTFHHQLLCLFSSSFCTSCSCSCSFFYSSPFRISCTVSCAPGQSCIQDSSDQQITHDHSIMGTANDKSYDTTHDNLEDDTHQYIHQVSHQDSTPSAVILHLIPHFQLVQKRILRKRVKHIILDRTA